MTDEQKAEKRGGSPVAVAAAHEKVWDAMLERIRFLGYDDGAGDREVVRRRRAARAGRGLAGDPARRRRKRPAGPVVL